MDIMSLERGEEMDTVDIMSPERGKEMDRDGRNGRHAPERGSGAWRGAEFC